MRECVFDTRRVGHLHEAALQPSVRTGINHRPGDVVAVRSLVSTCNTESLIAPGDHLRIMLTISCESHHELRNADRQRVLRPPIALPKTCRSRWPAEQLTFAYTTAGQEPTSAGGCFPKPS